MRKLYKYLVWIFLILALLSFFITIFDRFWIIKSKSDAQIINKKKTKGEVELIIQYGSESFYLYFDKTIDIPFKTNEYVELYYS